MVQCTVWWALPIVETQELLALLSPVERERYAAYRRDPDRLRFLTGRVLAKTMAADRLGTSPAEIEFVATCPDCGKQHGRPHIPGVPLELSISHSGERVGVALTDDVAVGLDVEAAREHADSSLIAYVLNDAELEAVRRLPAAARTEAFLTYWTRKEAVMKATGRGLRIPLRSLTLSGPGQHPRLLASEDAGVSPDVVRMADLGPGRGYRAAVALLGGEEIEVTERWWGAQSGSSGQYESRRDRERPA